MTTTAARLPGGDRDEILAAMVKARRSRHAHQDLGEEDPDLYASPPRAALDNAASLPASSPIGAAAPGSLQVEIALRMGTESQGPGDLCQSGADTRLSTVARYAAALGVKVDWTITPVRPGLAPALSSRRALEAS